jgi:hypothetical protein
MLRAFAALAGPLDPLTRFARRSSPLNSRFRRVNIYGIAVDIYTAMPYTSAMQTVIETRTYIKAATRAGLNEAEMAAVVDLIAANPDADVAIQGTGGCRKVRVAGRGKGKCLTRNSEC